MKTILLISFFLLVGLITNAQSFLQTVVVGDTIVLTSIGANSIQWQKSEDSLLWSDIPGATYTPFELIATTSSTGKIFFRAVIISENINCSGISSSVILLKIKNTTAELQIGDWFQGGIVFQPNSTDGLLAAEHDQSFNIAWGCYGQDIGAYDTIDGISNTNLIVSECNQRPIAAHGCDTITNNGYSDWYLPAISQLSTLMGLAGAIGGFNPPGRYWSSTESSAEMAFLITHSYNNSISIGTDLKWNEDASFYKSRCIRAYNSIPVKYYLTAIFDIMPVFDSENICLVSIDTTTWKNKVIWNTTSEVGTQSFNIFKETGINEYTLLGSVPFLDPSEFVDYSSQPESHADIYKISVVDTCGNESELSPYHKTMNLVISTFGSTMGLIWTPYQDESGEYIPNKYFIFKGTQANNMQLIDSLSASFTSYNDPNVYDSYYYMIGVRRDDLCNPYKASQINFSFSNPKLNFETNINEPISVEIKVYPNPANDNLFIEGIENGFIEILNLEGQVILTTEVTENVSRIDIEDLSSGVYSVRIRTKEGIATKKLVKR